MPTHDPRPPSRHTVRPARSPFRVLVTGSRTWTDAAAITTALDQLHARHGEALRIVHGACPRGADAIADAWAARHGIPVEPHPADWRAGRGAGPARNAAMVATTPDACLAFIADASPGATDTAARAEAAGIPTTRHTTGNTTGNVAGRGAAGQTAGGTQAGADPSTGRPGRVSGQGAVLAAPADDDGQLVAVVDGPLAGQWFTWPDWQQRLRAARHTLERSGHRSPSLDYVPAGYQVPNPVLAHTHGWVAVYRPTPAALAAAERAAAERAVAQPPHATASAAAADPYDDAVEDECAGDDADAYGDVYDVAG